MTSERFPPQFDHQLLRLAAEGTDRAYFGLDVLSGLIKGIVDYRREYMSRQSHPAHWDRPCWARSCGWTTMT
jgi:hypothetical protein